MTTPLVGSLRGYRWWRLGATIELLSPWRGPVRWQPGENEATCLGRRAMLGWRSARRPHPRGCPEVGCECGFYGLHAIPELNETPSRSIWELDAGSSGGRHGLVLGVVEGHGRVLIGTEGFRARFGRILALYAGDEGDGAGARRPPLDEVARRYGVPCYRDLTAMAGEWGPDRDELQRLIA